LSIDVDYLVIKRRCLIPLSRSNLGSRILELLNEEPRPIRDQPEKYAMREEMGALVFYLNPLHIWFFLDRKSYTKFISAGSKGKIKNTDFEKILTKKAIEYMEAIRPTTPFKIQIIIGVETETECECDVKCFPYLYDKLRIDPKYKEKVTDEMQQIAREECLNLLERLLPRLKARCFEDA